MDLKNKDLAINGGLPVASEPVPIHQPFFDEDDFSAADRAIRSTFVSGDGPECRKFEKMLSEYLGVKHALYVNSATAALELAFRVKNFKPGSEVIVPDFTYTSTALGALYNNLKIVLADVYPDNGSIDVSKIEKLITKKTVAIAPIDYAGIPADMNSIQKIADKYGLYVVHDTAQSIGSEYHGIKTGNFGDVSTFSFHGTKNLTTGEGGALVTNNTEIADRVKILREKGTDKYHFITENRDRGYYEYVDIGNSYVQSNILGALGTSQLRKIDRMNELRRETAEFYLKEMSALSHIKFLRIPDGVVHNWHIFGILVPIENKLWIMDALRAEGIMANIHYNPLHCNRFYKDLGTDKDFPGAVAFFNSFLRLPLYTGITRQQRENVVKAMKKVLL